MQPLPLTLEDVTKALLTYHPAPDLGLIKKAYLYAATKHKGQKRETGEDYINHPLHVAKILCDLKLDETTIASALLHDVIEDTDATYEEISELFGKQVADIVQGVTNLSKLSFESREAREAEQFRKMLLAMAKDIRVILVKLADRLHNMRTLTCSNLEKCERKARETMDIYAPLANRLGLYSIKSELEDISFKHVMPDQYRELEKKLKSDEKKRGKFLELVKGILERELKGAGLDVEVQARVKHKYSIYRKMERQGVPLEKVYDIVALRVIVNTVEQCWQAFGVVHQLWRPVPGRFRDYISLPKPNGYQSLHTSVLGPGAERIEVQIRTKEMHEQAERGIAAHWKYKEGGVQSLADEARIRYLKQLIEELMDLNETVRDSMELLTAVKEGLAFEEIFVFTPKGDVKSLPRGATPVDFAFAVHSEVGLHCAGARVNGVMVPLNHVLKNGDVVEILTQSNQRPSQDWLRFLKSPRAKAKVRKVLRAEAYQRFKQLGKVLLEKELKKHGITFNQISKAGKVEQIARGMGLPGEETLYFQVGSGKLETEAVASLLIGSAGGGDGKSSAQARPAFWERFRISGKGKVLVGGQEDIMVRYGKCCNPIPGERIVGFVTRGRGITVHSASCPYIQVVDQDRLVEVEWDATSGNSREVTIKVTSVNRTGLLARMTQVFSAQGVNISQAVVRTSSQKAENVFKVQVRNLSQLKTILRALQRVQGVMKVERVQG